MLEQVEAPLNVLVIGAAIAGVGIAVRLKQAGVDDVVIIDSAEEIGGRWRSSAYPGSVGDELSMLYSYSFAPNTSLQSWFADRAAVLRYMRDLVVDNQLGSQLRLGQRVTGLTYHRASAIWQVSVDGGADLRARKVVLATGAGAGQRLPLSGMDTFDGPVLRTNAWDEKHDFSGQAVCVIAAGSSAVHLVPELVQRARKVTVFQRTPEWILPKFGGENLGLIGKPAASEPMAGVARAAVRRGVELGGRGLVWRGLSTRLIELSALAHLNRQVRDPWFRRNLRPNYRVGSRRVVFSSDYYPALQQDNCRLVFWPVIGLSPVGVRSSDALVHRADCVVLATDPPAAGIAAPFPIRGIDEMTLEGQWRDGPAAFRGVNVPGFPNLFLLGGPRSGTAAFSGLANLEAQIDYIVESMALLASLALVSLEARPEALAREQEQWRHRQAKTTWGEGVSLWYREEDTTAAELYPGTAREFRRQLADINVADYKLLTEYELSRIAGQDDHSGNDTLTGVTP